MGPCQRQKSRDPRLVAGCLMLAAAMAGCGSTGVSTVERGTCPRCVDPFNGGAAPFETKGWRTNFCLHSVSYASILSGGVPRDGIPAIDNPQFVSVAQASRWIRPNEPVIALEHGGLARAYPLQVLTWHEIVNDRIGDAPVTVTFCPLCYSALVFERPVINGKLLTFGVSGKLRNSDLIMWDRQTQSWWQQFSGEAIVGALTGTTLTSLPAAIVSWQQFRTQFPNATVLSRKTGHKRPYGANPYTGYDDINKRPMLYEGKVDGALPPMAHVVGINVKGAARAYRREIVASAGAINDELGDSPIVLLYEPGATSALDSKMIASSKNIGAVGVFSRRLDGRVLTFYSDASGLRDRETASRWNVLGKAVAGPLTGRALRPVMHHDAFWFAWSAFVPGAELYRASGKP